MAKSDPVAPAGQQPPLPRVWLERVESRVRTLSKDWLKEANKTQDIYDAKDPQKYPFNILYSNTETILPALYNSTPRPEVARRFTSYQEKKAPIDGAVSQTIQRSLEFLADTNQSDYETFSGAVRAAVMGMLVPGMGQVRARLHEEGSYQTVCFDSVPFDRFVWAYARKWESVPWVAFGHDLSRVDFESTYPEFARSEDYKGFDWKALEDEARDRSREEAEESLPRAEGPVLLVWEIWDYATKSILHVCSTFPGKTLLEEPYPSALTSRFPCPQPLLFARKGRSLTPIPPYTFYEKQAEELNDITRRMRRIVRAIRARGVYNSLFGEIQTLLNEDDDNVLVPSEGAQAFQDSGLDKQIWFMPIDMLVSTYLQLRQARDECKQSIYEIMGIGDILRGSSDPNETAKAQQIKNTWGSLRIKKGQVLVQQFCLDLFRIAVELATEYFTPATWQQMTQLPYLFEAQKGMLQAQQQQWQMAAAQAQQMGQQPPPSPLPPEAQAQLAQPSWEDIMAVLRDRFQRTFRIDIETNSTVDLEATEDKESIAEFMNAFGQMMSGLTPLVEQKILPFEGAKVILGEVTRRFRFGRRVEDVLMGMQEPAPPEDEAGKAALAKTQVEMERIRSEGAKRLLEAEQTITQLHAQVAQKNLELVGTKQAADMSIAQKDVETKQAVGQMRSDYQGKLVQQQTQQANEKISANAKQASMGLEQQFSGLMQQLKDQERAIQSMVDQAQALEQQRVAAEAESEDDVKESEVLSLFEKLAQSQEQLMKAVEQVAKIAAADREAEIFIGPDGKKKSRSRTVLQ